MGETGLPPPTPLQLLSVISFTPTPDEGDLWQVVWTVSCPSSLLSSLLSFDGGRVSPRGHGENWVGMNSDPVNQQTVLGRPLLVYPLSSVWSRSRERQGSGPGGVGSREEVGRNENYPGPV